MQTERRRNRTNACASWASCAKVNSNSSLCVDIPCSRSPCRTGAQKGRNDFAECGKAVSCWGDGDASSSSPCPTSVYTRRTLADVRRPEPQIMPRGIQYIALKSAGCPSHQPLGRRIVAYIPSCKTFTRLLHFTVSQINLLAHHPYSLAVCWKLTAHVSLFSFQIYSTYTNYTIRRRDPCSTDCLLAQTFWLSTI